MSEQTRSAPSRPLSLEEANAEITRLRAELAVREDLSEFESRFNTQRELGEIGSDEQIAARLAELEATYC